MKEIAIVLPPSRNRTGKTPTTPEEDPKTTLIDVPDLEGVTIDSSSIAPDGYEFSVGRDRYSAG